MKQRTSARRNTSALPPLQPDFAAANPKPNDFASPSEKQWMLKMLAGERRRHGSVEAVLTRHIQTLEQQVADLRQLYFASIAVKTGPAQ
jgi:hypothetical protein